MLNLVAKLLEKQENFNTIYFDDIEVALDKYSYKIFPQENVILFSNEQEQFFVNLNIVKQVKTSTNVSLLNFFM